MTDDEITKRIAELEPLVRVDQYNAGPYDDPWGGDNAQELLKLQRMQNKRKLDKLHLGNRFRLMFGQPLLPYNQLHFWSDYSETIILGFKTAEDASQALEALNAKFKFENATWKQEEKKPEVLYIFLTGDDVETAHKLLGQFGSDVRKISSVKHSIDHGEVFNVQIEIEDNSP